jgi:ligand-binding SRPBCC domain-containing protein
VTDVRVTRSVAVDAPVEQVWDLVITPEGIDHELRPLLSMTMPAAYRDATIATVPVGERLGRAWLRLGGVLPVDYDDLRLVSVDPPHAFHECSSMLSARVWEHRRSLTDLGAGRTLVTDELRMVPRVPLPAPARALVAQALRALFAHRHRRLQAALATAGRPLD